MNRQQLRAKLKKSNKEIDRLLMKLGEDPEVKEFSSDLVDKLENLRLQEQQEEEENNKVPLESLEDLIKLLSPCEASIVENLKEAHKVMVNGHWKGFLKIRKALNKERLRDLEVTGNGKGIEVIDIEATNSSESNLLPTSFNP